MIQVFSYIVPCEYGVLIPINDRCKILARNKSYLLEASAMWSIEDRRMLLTLRVTGTDRWKIARYARQTAKTLLGRHGLLTKGEPPVPVSVVTEQNMRGLTLDEGRTVRDYPTRAQRSARKLLARSSSTGTVDR